MRRESFTKIALAYFARGHCKLRAIAKVRAYLRRLEAIREVFLRITVQLWGTVGEDKSDEKIRGGG